VFPSELVEKSKVVLVMVPSYVSWYERVDLIKVVVVVDVVVVVVLSEMRFGDQHSETVLVVGAVVVLHTWSLSG
jgi:hypothetical protein